LALIIPFGIIFYDTERLHVKSRIHGPSEAVIQTARWNASAAELELSGT
jgi:hypothetical protein